MHTPDLIRVLTKAARGALLEWGQDDGLEDLVQDLWLWWRERPSTQEKMEELSFPEQVKTVKIHALQLLSEQTLNSNLFQGRNLYSGDSIKDALKGKSTNRYLVDILPTALAALEDQNEGHAEAIRSRYTDMVVPSQGDKKMLLSRAAKALTEQVNIIVITADADAYDRCRPGSAASVDPDTRKQTGSRPSDPTAAIALQLMEFPELREVFEYELPLDLLLKGAYAQPVRFDVQRDARVRDVPSAGGPGSLPAREADADPELA